MIIIWIIWIFSLSRDVVHFRAPGIFQVLAPSWQQRDDVAAWFCCITSLDQPINRITLFGYKTRVIANLNHLDIVAFASCGAFQCARYFPGTLRQPDSRAKMLSHDFAGCMILLHVWFCCMYEVLWSSSQLIKCITMYGYQTRVTRDESYPIWGLPASHSVHLPLSAYIRNIIRKYSNIAFNQGKAMYARPVCMCTCLQWAQMCLKNRASPEAPFNYWVKLSSALLNISHSKQSAFELR